MVCHSFGSCMGAHLFQSSRRVVQRSIPGGDRAPRWWSTLRAHVSAARNSGRSQRAVLQHDSRPCGAEGPKQIGNDVMDEQQDCARRRDGGCVSQLCPGLRARSCLHTRRTSLVIETIYGHWSCLWVRHCRALCSVGAHGANYAICVCVLREECLASLRTTQRPHACGRHYVTFFCHVGRSLHFTALHFNNSGESF